MDNFESEVYSVIRATLRNEALHLAPELPVQKIDGWTSLVHANVMVALERRLLIRFEIKEVVHLKTVGQLVTLVRFKREGKLRSGTA